MQSSKTADANNIVLKDIRVFSFDSKGKPLSVASPNTSVWIAISCFESSSINNNISNQPLNRSISHQLQQQAVRQLFYSLVQQLLEHCQFHHVEPKAIKLPSTFGLNFQQSSYPYRLLPFNYYVCFTHSADNVACAINKHRPIGIDIESHPISLSVAQRFYNDEEIQWLSTLDAETQPQALNLLWMLKEAAIKIDFTENNHLLSGVRKSMLNPTQQLLQFDTNHTATDSKNRHSKLLANKENQTDSKLKAIALNQHIYLQLVAENLVAVW